MANSNAGIYFSIKNLRTWSTAMRSPVHTLIERTYQQLPPGLEGIGIISFSIDYLIMELEVISKMTMQIYINVILTSFRLQRQTFRSLVRELRYLQHHFLHPSVTISFNTTLPGCQQWESTPHIPHGKTRVSSVRSWQLGVCYTAQLQNRPRSHTAHARVTITSIF